MKYNGPLSVWWQSFLDHPVPHTAASTASSPNGPSCQWHLLVHRFPTRFPSWQHKVAPLLLIISAGQWSRKMSSICECVKLYFYWRYLNFLRNKVNFYTTDSSIYQFSNITHFWQCINIGKVVLFPISNNTHSPINSSIVWFVSSSFTSLYPGTATTIFTFSIRCVTRSILRWATALRWISRVNS